MELPPDSPSSPSSPSDPAGEGETRELTWDQALAVCDEGIARYGRPGADSLEERWRLAEAWFARGQVLECRPETVADAVKSYDSAIAAFARIEKSATQGKEVDHRVAQAWMNRGNAVQKQSGAGGAEEAVKSYARAIDLLRHVPVEAFGERCTLGTAWLNRGVAEQQRPGTGRAEAAKAFDEAIAVLRTLPIEKELHFRTMLAAAMLSRAGVAVASPQPEARGAGVEGARQVVQLLRGTEVAGPMTLDLALKARCLLCEVFSATLGSGTVPPAIRDQLRTETTDMLEEGLRLVEQVEQQGGDMFRPVANWLFRLGLSMYADHQPQFLGEYVREFLGGAALAPESDALRKLARDVVERARNDLHVKLFSLPAGPEATKWTEALEDLKAVRAELG